jgi:prephenate dehydratase
MSRFNYSAESLPGDIHFLGGFFLVHSLKVCQSYCLKLIESDINMLQNRKRNSTRLIIIRSGLLANPSEISRSGHIKT